LSTDQTGCQQSALAFRRNKAAIALARKKLRHKATKNGSQLQPQTLFYAQYVMVLSTFPEEDFSPDQ